MEIGATVSIADFVRETHDEIRLISHPGGESIQQALSTDDEIRSVAVLIGPEGGFTQREVDQAVSADFQEVGLGERIYRIETSAAVIATLLA